MPHHYDANANIEVKKRFFCLVIIRRYNGFLQRMLYAVVKCCNIPDYHVFHIFPNFMNDQCFLNDNDIKMALQIFFLIKQILVK